MDLNNNSSLHMQFIFSWRSDAQTVLVHLSLALNRAVFMGELMDPDMQSRGFEYQQRVSMVSDCLISRACWHGKQV